MFRRLSPLAWTFHQNSSRWLYNTLRLDENRREAAVFREDATRPLHVLPPPQALTVTLTQAVEARVSCRQFQPGPLPLQALSSVLHYAYGVLERPPYDLEGTEMLRRPVPSGGGLYPLEVSVVCRAVDDLAPGLYHYVPLHHGLEAGQRGAPPPPYVTALFMDQPYVAEAACVLVISFVPARSLWKYEDRGYRYALFEAGHLAQNVNLLGAALGLGSLNLGGFFDQDLSELLRLDPEQEVPLYAVALGLPKALKPHELRMPSAL